MYISNVRKIRARLRSRAKAPKFRVCFQFNRKSSKTTTMASNHHQTAPVRVKEKELSDNERIELVSMLLGMEAVGVLPNGAISNIAKKFDVSRATASRLWNRAKTSRSVGRCIASEVISQKDRRGRSMKWDGDAIKEAIKEIKCKKRKTYRAAASALGLPKTSLHRLRQKIIVRHSNAIKPSLTDMHKAYRIEYALSMRDPNNLLEYQNMYDMVHIDEKWFYMTEENMCCILAIDEDPPQRSTRHKSFISKVMFLCAQARPRMVRGRLWDGKIGLWPVGHIEEATRSSKNRPKGSPVWKNETINRDKYRQLMIDKVLPAILAKFPVTYLRDIGVRIQQDGAKSHIADNDKEWLEAVKHLAEGNKITLFTQPAQSPDLNINDLAFFRSIQTLYCEESPSNELELIDAVQRSYQQYPAAQINRMWLTLQGCLNEILLSSGDNHYSIPHINKAKLEKEGKLPVVLPVAKDIRQLVDGANTENVQRTANVDAIPTVPSPNEPSTHTE